MQEFDTGFMDYDTPQKYLDRLVESRLSWWLSTAITQSPISDLIVVPMSPNNNKQVLQISRSSAASYLQDHLRRGHIKIIVAEETYYEPWYFQLTQHPSANPDLHQPLFTLSFQPDFIQRYQTDQFEDDYSSYFENALVYLLLSLIKSGRTSPSSSISLPSPDEIIPYNPNLSV